MKYLSLRSNFFLLCISALVSACTSVPKEKVSFVNKPINEMGLEDKRAAFPNEINNTKQDIGISLSGGGMRSASFSIGVLSGLNDNDILSNVNYISTVSGGGYAAYWYLSSLHYSQNMLVDEDALPPNLSAFFYDCYPNHEDGFGLYEGTENHLYNDECENFTHRKSAKYRFQHQVAQQSDLLNYYHDGGGSFLQNTKLDAIQLGEYTGIVSAHLLSIPLHHVANTIFDWNVQISPLKTAYNYGIERAFGLYPINLMPIKLDSKEYKNPQALLWMDNYAAQDLSFNSIRKAYRWNKAHCANGKYGDRKCNPMPFWIINTAANLNRSVCGVSITESKSNRIFEFTPESYGSESNGYVDKPYSNLSVSDVVQLSGAAMDSQYSSLSGPLGSFGLHLLNFNLGQKVDNYHPDSPNSQWRSLLPIPFYCFPRVKSPSEASSIYLSDGAHVEHTGAYALIRRGVKNVIMVDASQDNKGEWLEVKNLAEMLKQEHGLDLTLSQNGLDGKPTLIPLLDAHGQVIIDMVVNPNHANQNIYKGTVTGFSKGFVDDDEEQNLVNIWFIKTGIVNEWMASNCENEAAYPCSVSTYYAHRHNKKGDECVGIDNYLFPNNSTIGMSFEMAQNIYYAYRDLGRYIAKKIKRGADGELSVEIKPRGIADLIPLNKCK